MQCAVIVGGPGSGKTTKLLDIMDKILLTDIKDPLQIGFVSFTRAARREASARAAAHFGLKPEMLEQQGWFRTVHSLCHKAIGVGPGQLLTGDAKGRAWLKNALQADVEIGDAEDHSSFGDYRTDEAKALALWDLSRNRLEPFVKTHHWVYGDTFGVTSATQFWGTIARYEAAKQAEGMLDFTDLLGRASSIRFTGGWPEQCDYGVKLPDLPAVIIDEAQDNSTLVDRVCQALTVNCRWAYLAGDNLQAIFSFAGANPQAMMWPHVKKEVLPQSYRCPVQFLEPARNIARRTEHWEEHEFRPNGSDGVLDSISRIASLRTVIDPRQDTLVLARSNYLAKRLSERLTEDGIPWRPTKGRGGFDAPRKVAIVRTVAALQRGEAIAGEEWASLVRNLPVMEEGVRYLEHGVKEQYKDPDVCERLPPVRLGEITEHGGTPALVEKLRANGDWCGLVKGTSIIQHALQTHGEAMLAEPNVRVGTIHSAKGAESSHVVLWDALTEQTAKAMLNDRARQDEERRVWYVGMTRAKHRLTVLRASKLDGVQREFKLT